MKEDDKGDVRRRRRRRRRKTLHFFNCALSRPLCVVFLGYLVNEGVTVDVEGGSYLVQALLGV